MGLISKMTKNFKELPQGFILQGFYSGKALKNTGLFGVWILFLLIRYFDYGLK